MREAPKGAGKTSVRDHVERLLNWLSPNSYSEERRTSIRRPMPDLAAYSMEDGEPRKFAVGDISSTGIYLRTGERLEPGDTLELMLQHSGPFELSRDRRMDVRAGVVRRGRDGVGLAFDLPEDMHLDLWECAAQGKARESGPEYIVNEMRMARALGTIRRICPSVLDDVKRMLEKEFSNVRVAGAVRIAYFAEEMLAREASAEPRLAPAELVTHILEVGSWADVDWIVEMWGGLLASACSRNGEDMSNSVFIEMLSKLAPVHLHILISSSDWAAAAGRAAETAAIPGCTAGEIAKALDLTNLTKTLRSIQELAEMGLMKPVRRSPSEPHDESARTAITQLGLEMVARCHGRRLNAVPEVAQLDVSRPAHAC